MLTELFNDDFATLNTSLWTAFPSGWSVSNSTAIMPCTSTYNEMTTTTVTAGKHDLTNSFISFKWNQFPNAGNGSGQLGVIIYKNGTNSIEVTREMSSTGTPALTVKNTVSGTTTPTSIYAGANDFAWRVRHKNGWLYIDTSYDGARWINRYSIATAVTWSGLIIKVYCWYYDSSTTPANPGQAVLDWVSHPVAPTPRLLDVGEVWNGKLKTSWQSDQSAYAGTSPAPDGNGDRIVQGNIGGRTGVITMFALATDVSPKTPTANPRAQLNAPDLLEPEHVYQHEFDLYFPSASTYTGAWPASGDRWSQWIQLGYGFPYQGSGPVRLISRSATTLGISEVDTQVWSTAMPWDKWCRFVFRQRMSKTRPWYELYYSPDIDTTPVSLVIPRKKVATIDYSQDGGAVRLIANTYFSAVLGAGVSKVGPIGFDNVKTTRLQDTFPIV